MGSLQTMASWPPFEVDGTVYLLSHLDDIVLQVEDSEKATRGIRVSFSDHCFTRDPVDKADPAPFFPDCSRGKGGRFCVDRYTLSLDLPNLVKSLTGGVVWNTDGDHYAVVSAQVGGVRRDYAVVFSLDPLKGFQGIHLQMRIRSAHARDGAPINTFGNVRFAHLMTLRIANRRPNKVFDNNRKRPK